MKTSNLSTIENDSINEALRNFLKVCKEQKVYKLHVYGDFLKDRLAFSVYYFLRKNSSKNGIGKDMQP